MKWIKQLIIQYIEHERTMVQLMCVLPKNKTLSTNDLRRIACRYVMQGNSISFLDE